ncbi:MAG: hypothetical protein ACI9Z4_001684 [Polaribacter sp.]
MIVIFFLSNSVYSQSKDVKSKNLISIKNFFFSTLLFEENYSFIFNQSESSSNLFNNNFLDYNISFQRKISFRLFLGIDYYSFSAFNEIDPISLSLRPVLERNKFLSKTGIQQVRISGLYNILIRNNFIIRASLYIPFFEHRKIDLTLIYQDAMNQNSLFSQSVSGDENKVYLGITNSEVAIDFLYDFNFLEAGISTSWNSTVNKNEPIIRFSAVLNIYL